MPGPEFNPRDDEQPTQEEWEAYERERDALLIPNQPATDVLDVEAIEKRLAAATPGPYQYCCSDRGDCQCGSVYGLDGDVAIHCATSNEDFDIVPNIPEQIANAAFFAHSWQDIRALLTALAARDAEIERLEAEHLERDRLEGAQAVNDARNHPELHKYYKFDVNAESAFDNMTAIVIEQRLAQRNMK